MTPVRDGDEGIPGQDVPVSGVLKPSEVLAKAADLIEPKGAWLQRQCVGAKRKRPCGYDDASCFCLFGSVVTVCHRANILYAPAWRMVEIAVGPSPIVWNDAPERTQAEVVAALRGASALAAEAGQ